MNTQTRKHKHPHARHSHGGYAARPPTPAVAAIRDKVGAAIRDRVGAAIRDGVGAAIRDRMGAAIRDRVGAAIRDRVGAAIRDRVGLDRRRCRSGWIGRCLIVVSLRCELGHELVVRVAVDRKYVYGPM